MAQRNQVDEYNENDRPGVEEKMRLFDEKIDLIYKWSLEYEKKLSDGPEKERLKEFHKQYASI